MKGGWVVMCHPTSQDLCIIARILGIETVLAMGMAMAKEMATTQISCLRCAVENCTILNPITEDEEETTEVSYDIIILCFSYSHSHHHPTERYRICQ